MTNSVVLVCLDSVRKDYFDRFAERLTERSDVRYRQCRAASSWSVPSHASMLTGTLPSRHGIHTYNPDYRTLPTADTFLDDLPTHTTLGVSANVYASHAFGFDTHFDEFVSVSPNKRFPRGLDVEEFSRVADSEGARYYFQFLRAALGHDHPAASLANGTLAQLSHLADRLPVATPFDDGARAVAREARRLVARTDGPFFLFLNMMDAHVPNRPVRAYDESLYDAPATWSSSDLPKWDINRAETLDEYETDLGRFRDLYGASIDYLDRVVDSLIDDLERATDEDVTVVVTADHGENLGYDADDGQLGHDSSVSEGLMHVPLCVVNPPEPTTRDTDAFVSHLSLGDLMAGLGTGETPDVGAERIAGERIGTPNLEALADQERWNLGYRCVYEGERKTVCRSDGTVEHHELDHERANWSTVVERDGECDHPAFEGDLAEIVATSASDRSETPDAVTDRLSRLGYRA